MTGGPGRVQAAPPPGPLISTCLLQEGAQQLPAVRAWCSRNAVLEGCCHRGGPTPLGDSHPVALLPHPLGDCFPVWDGHQPALRWALCSRALRNSGLRALQLPGAPSPQLGNAQEEPYK